MATKVTFVEHYQSEEIAEVVATALTSEWSSCYVQEAKDKSGWSVLSKEPHSENRNKQMSLWASGVLYGKYGEYRG